MKYSFDFLNIPFYCSEYSAESLFSFLLFFLENPSYYITIL